MDPFAGRDLVSLRQVAAWLDLSERTIRRRVEDGEFPRPIVVSGHQRWRVEDLKTWAAAKALGITIKPEAESRPTKKPPRDK